MKGAGSVCETEREREREREDDWAKVGEVSQFRNRFFLNLFIIIKLNISLLKKRNCS